MVKNLPANAGYTGLIPGPGRSHMHRKTSGPHSLEPTLHKRSPSMRSPHTTTRKRPLLSANSRKPAHSNEGPAQKERKGQREIRPKRRRLRDTQGEGGVKAKAEPAVMQLQPANAKENWSRNLGERHETQPLSEPPERMNSINTLISDFRSPHL